MENVSGIFWSSAYWLIVEKLWITGGKVVDNWWKSCGLPNKKRGKISSSSFGIVYVQ
jgi:hypothetical protein